MIEIKLDDFIQFTYLSGLTANSSQIQLAYIRSKASLKKNEYHHTLYVFDGDNHQKIQFLNDKSHYLWDQDDLIFQYAKTKQDEKLFKDEKRTLYYRYDAQTRQVHPYYTLPIPGQIVKILDPNTLLVSSFLKPDDHQLYQLSGDERKAFLKRKKENEAYEAIDEIPFYFNGQGFVNQKRNQLLLLDMKEMRLFPMVDLLFNVGVTRVSADKRKIYYTGQTHQAIKDLTHGIYEYDVLNKETKTLLSQGEFSIKNIYLVNHKVVVAASKMDRFGINQNPDFYVCEHGELRLLSTYGNTLGNTIGSDVRLMGSSLDIIHNQHLYFVTTVDDHSEVLRLNQDGHLEKFIAFNGSIDGLAVMNDTFYGIALYQQRRQDLYQLTSKKPIRVSKHNPILKNHYVAKPKTITIKKEGHHIKGWVLYPKDYHPDLKYPCILDIHGGPKTVYGPVYYHEMQVWANKGYFVCFANPRGADGKGNLFADIRGKYGTIDYHDLMDFMDEVLKKEPSIDSSQLFVTGGSYGGFMTNWIIGHTHRFKAAVTQRSISNWLSFHGTSDIGFYFSNDQTDGHPLHDTEKLWDQSPIKYVPLMKTPLLIIHSDQDYRCPIEQGMQLFTHLKEQGVPTKFVWFKGENHELSRSGKPLARIKRLHEITQWFEGYRKTNEFEE